MENASKTIHDLRMLLRQIWPDLAEAQQQEWMKIYPQLCRDVDAHLRKKYRQQSFSLGFDSGIFSSDELLEETHNAVST